MLSGMRAILPVITAAAITAAAAIVLAGCGTAHAPAAAGAHPTTTTSSTAVARQTPKQRAEADAAAILASFAVPPGATKLSSAPSAGRGALKQPFGSPFTLDLVDDAAWWQAPGQPLQVLGWEQAHLPSRFSTASGPSTAAYKGRAYAWSYDFALPAITGVLNSRGLTVLAVAAGNGTTDLRVDAQVTWIPTRAASEAVPPAARAVTLSLLANSNSGLPGPVTITDPARVRALTAFIDGLPLFPPGPRSCPMYMGDTLTLTFRARPDGPALAVATVQLSGCEEVDFTVGGKLLPQLGGPDNGRADAARVLTIAGLHWQISRLFS
jgi:hypothetical protein